MVGYLDSNFPVDFFSYDVFSSIDRAVCVLFPLRTRQYCHRHLAWKITIVLSIVDGLLNSHLFYGFFISKFRLTSNEIVEICHHRSDSLFYEKFFYLYDSYVDVVKTNFIPFLIMTICNAIIIHRVCRQRSSFNDENQRRCNVKSKRKQEKDRQLTLMLLASSIAFLVLTLPTEINDFIRFHSVNKSVDEKSYLVSSIFLSLAHLNYAVSQKENRVLFVDISLVSDSFLHLHVDWRSVPSRIDQDLAFAMFFQFGDARLGEKNSIKFYPSRSTDLNVDIRSNFDCSLKNEKKTLVRFV